MHEETKKRIIWFSVFMVWIGMVAAILIYQEANPGQLTPATNLPTEETVNQEAAPSPGQSVTPTPAQTSGGQEATDAKGPVVKEETGGQDFFVQYRLERDKARSEQINIFREMINNPNTDPTSKKSAQESLLLLSKDIEQEMEVESLIRARGYADALAYKHENSIDLIIQTPGLTEADVIKIGDIVTRVTSLRLEDITIIEKRITK